MLTEATFQYTSRLWQVLWTFHELSSVITHREGLTKWDEHDFLLGVEEDVT